jgi:membrane-bound metal-dependent hydrolase YbcI (DUF457 family)
MRAATHLAVAGLTGVVATGFGAQFDVASGAALAVGSLLPDIDTQHSGLGKFCKPISGFIERKVGHRTLTHSLLGLALLALGASWLLLIHPPVYTWLLVGYATHLLLDTANVTGVPLFWPHRLQFWMVANRSWRVPYGSPREFTWLACISLAAVALVPLSLDGFAPWFHRFLATPYGAVEDYLRWRDDYEVWADISGVNLTLREDVNGRYRIIDALNTEALLVEDDMGRAYSVGLGQAHDITSRRIRVWRGEAIVASTYRLDLAGRLVSDLIHSLPKGARRVYVNAALNLKGHVEHIPTLGTFDRLKRHGNEWEIRAATIGDLAQLSHMAIEGGSALVRAEYSPGAQVAATLPLAVSLPPVKSHLLAIPNLPSLAGLVVSVGDEVAEGELIARYIDDTQLAVSEAEASAAEARIPELERTISLETQAHEQTVTDLKARLNEAREKLERTRYLVERDAAPRARLLAAEADVREAERALLAAETKWTTRLHQLQSQLRQANLTVARAQRNLAADVEKQWVRSPVSGVVSDVRLTGVTTRGVNLEVTILEGLEMRASPLPLPLGEAEANRP